MAINVAYGTYTGNDVDGRDIPVTPSFPIKAVFYHATTAQNNNAGGATMSISGMGDLAATIYQNDTAQANIIQSMGTGTFQLGSGAVNYSANRNLVVYYYVAIGGDATDVSVNTYNGNNTDGRAITGAGFLPGIVFVIDTASNTKAARFATTGDSSHYLANAADVPDQIQSLDADGFTVGLGNGDTNINTTGHTYYWCAIKESAGFCKAEAYTGSVGAQSISSTGFKPDLVFIKGKSTQFAVFRTPQNVGDDTSPTQFNTANFTGGITSLDTSGFSLGTDSRVNTNGAGYSYFAIKNNAGGHNLTLMGAGT